MSELWFFADPHFGHEAIRCYCHRPWSTIKDHDDAILQRYNELVSPRDDVIFLGDFAFRNHEKYIAKLPGKKTFVFGNHDRMSMEALRNFSRVIGARHCPGVVELSVGAFTVTGSHFPMASWNASHYGAWHVHGHCHGRMPEPEHMLRCDVGVDVWDYYPVNFELVRRKMTARLPAWRQRQSELDKLHDNELPGEDTRENRAKDIPLLRQWFEDRAAGLLDTGEYHTRYNCAKYDKMDKGVRRVHDTAHGE